MQEQNQSQKTRERISVLVGEGLLTELDLSELLGLPIRRVVSLIEDGHLPGRRIGYNFKRLRTLSSIKQLIKYAEKGNWKADEST